MKLPGTACKHVYNQYPKIVTGSRSHGLFCKLFILNLLRGCLSLRIAMAAGICVLTEFVEQFYSNRFPGTTHILSMVSRPRGVVNVHANTITIAKPKNVKYSLTHKLDRLTNVVYSRRFN